MEYVYHVLVIASVYGIATLGLDFFTGRAGVVSVCHAALMGVGAYTSALLVLKIGAPLWVGFSAGIMMAALVAPLVGLVSVRATGDYFVIATLALQVLFGNVVNSWDKVTGGPFGLAGIPVMSIAGYKLESPGAYLLFVLAVGACAVVTILYMERSAYLVCTRGARDDANLLRTSAKDSSALHLQAYVVGGAMAGLAGVLLAHYITFVDATTFSVEESILILAMALVGGLDRVWGPIVGALLLTGLPELLRLVIPSTVDVVYLRTSLYGLALVLVVVFRPTGLVGRFALYRSGDE